MRGPFEYSGGTTGQGHTLFSEKQPRYRCPRTPDGTPLVVSNTLMTPKPNGTLPSNVSSTRLDTRSPTPECWPHFGGIGDFAGLERCCLTGVTTELIVDKVLKVLTIFIPSLMLVLVLMYDFANSGSLNCLVPANHSSALQFVNSYCLTWLVSASNSGSGSYGFLLHRFVSSILLLQVALMSLPYIIWYFGLRRHLTSLLWTVQREYDRFFANLLKEVNALVEMYSSGYPLRHETPTTGGTGPSAGELPACTMKSSISISSGNFTDTSEILKELPRLRACHQTDWLLNSYARWAVYQPYQFKISPNRIYCTFPNTVFLNGVLMICMLVNLLALATQIGFCALYFYCPCTPARKFPSAYLKQTFFGTYITLIAYARHSQKFHLENIENLYVDVNPKLLWSDFHLISKMCDSNVDRFASYYPMCHWVSDKFLTATKRQVLDAKAGCYLLDNVALDFDLIKLSA